MDSNKKNNNSKNDNCTKVVYVSKNQLVQEFVEPKKMVVKKTTVRQNSIKIENHDPVAVVVGGSSGIGLQTAKLLCASGYVVFNLSRTDCPYAGVTSLRVDVTKKGEIKSAFDKILENYINIDCVIYCAGTSLACPIEHLSESDLRYLWEVNYFGFIKTLWACLPGMREAREGRVVVVSSMAGEIPIPFDAPYSGSKSAIDMTAMAINLELAPYNVFVTSVQPGGVATEFTFKRKVYEKNTVGEYADALSNAKDSLASIEQGGDNPLKVAQDICMLLEWSDPPSTYAVGIGNKALKVTQKFMPQALSNYINKRTFHLPKH